MHVLDCYRVLRVSATRAEWEKALYNQVSEVCHLIRRNLDADKRQARKEYGRSSEPDDVVVIEFEERPGPRSIGRSTEYIAGSLREAGFDLPWQHNKRDFMPSPLDDGRAWNH